MRARAGIHVGGTGGERGFSLVELLIAMVVTMIVSGAIYGLLASGQSAFRREPEVADRQQQIRAAMDLMVRDVGAAGVGMPSFIQAFAPGLNSCSPGADGQNCPNSPDLGAAPGGQRTDDLEMLSNPGGFDAEPTCHYPGGSAANVRLSRNTTRVRPGQVFLVLLENGKWTIREASGVQTNNSGAGDCPAGETRQQINFAPGQNPALNSAGGICAAGGIGSAAGDADCNVKALGTGEVVTYIVRPGPDGVPNLLRRATGSLTAGVPFATNFQVIARGVEDMQVQYLDAAGNWLDTPPVTSCDPATPGAVCCDPVCAQVNCATGQPPAYLGACTNACGCTDPTPAGIATLVREVRMTLTARTTVNSRLAGETQDAAGQSHVRGRLVSTVTVRSSHFALSRLVDPGTGVPYWQ